MALQATKPLAKVCQPIDLGGDIQAFNREPIPVIWISPTITSQIQPLAAGLINSWKASDDFSPVHFTVYLQGNGCCAAAVAYPSD